MSSPGVLSFTFYYPTTPLYPRIFFFFCLICFKLPQFVIMVSQNRLAPFSPSRWSGRLMVPRTSLWDNARRCQWQHQRWLKSCLPVSPYPDWTKDHVIELLPLRLTGWRLLQLLLKMLLRLQLCYVARSVHHPLDQVRGREEEEEEISK